VISQTVAPGQQVAPGTSVGVLVSKGARTIQVPTVINMLVDQARRELELLGLRTSSTLQYDPRVAEGRVIAQDPLPDTIVISGTLISLQTSRGPQPAPPPKVTTQTATPTTLPDSIVRVPKVVGLPEMEARNQIETARLTNTYTNYQKVGDVSAANLDAFLQTPAGSVVSQSPLPDAIVAPYTTVYIAVRSQ
jgi:serine/threonine-protein kinase